jgi:hypothetical protein
MESQRLVIAKHGENSFELAKTLFMLESAGEQRLRLVRRDANESAGFWGQPGKLNRNQGAIMLLTRTVVKCFLPAL